MVGMSRLCTVRIGSSTRAGRIDGDDIVILDAADVGDVLRADSEVAETGEAIPRETARLAPAVTAPDKVVCVGVNYLDHIEEMGRHRPSAPTYFAKFANSLIGATDDLVLPPIDVSTHIDWEVELAIVIGSPVRHASPSEALAAVAGYTVMNDGSVRDYQRRTTQFLAGKMFEGLSPLGPVLVGVDELGDGSGLGDPQRGRRGRQATELDIRAVLQRRRHRPGPQRDHDAHAGRRDRHWYPGRCGAARTPPEWLTDGAVLRCSIEGVGATENRCVLP